MGENNERKVKREIADNQEHITNVNDYIMFITHSDNQYELKYKNNYTDGSSNWIFEGWYSNEESLFKNIRRLIHCRNLKEKVEDDVAYFIKCFKEADDTIRDFFKI